MTVTLDEPNGSLPLLLDIPLALGAGERPVGTGPYLLSENGEEAGANRTGELVAGQTDAC